ncbi:universal stress protein [Salinibacterium xinjiangense]|uniref:universal stress protein n=1 Tax=Salinibacterium xinjiangense TaxID=386302 RepID=UPI000BE29B9B|nr:universal stress protein [Salinibacterium xinjiangense]GGL06559.1 universal stress protein [Salinibacterium xinjiangense]
MDTSSRTNPLIVVGVDGSNPSLAALEFASEYTQKLNGRLRAVSTWDIPIGDAALPLSWSPGENAEQELGRVSREVLGDPLPDWYEFTAREGSAARTLLDESRSADVLIVGSRGHGGFVGLLLGSVSSQCAAHSSCAVIVVHPTDNTSTDNTSSMSSAGPIVVGHDGSADADEALKWALATAAMLDTQLEVVRTWSIDHIPPQFTEEHGYVPSFEEVTARVHRDLVAGTHRLTEGHPNVEVTFRAALSQPAEALIESSKHARMIVVGSRGRGGFAGLVLGSVSTTCAAHAHCPVVVVPGASRA